MLKNFGILLFYLTSLQSIHHKRHRLGLFFDIFVANLRYTMVQEKRSRVQHVHCCNSCVWLAEGQDRKWLIYANEGVGVVDIYVGRREPPFIHHMVKSRVRSRHFHNFTTIHKLLPNQNSSTRGCVIIIIYFATTQFTSLWFSFVGVPGAVTVNGKSAVVSEDGGFQRRMS